MLQHSIGIWMSSFALGNFVGPTIGGIVVQEVGFQYTTLVFFVLYSIMLLTDIVQAIVYVAKSRNQSQYEQIG